MTTSFSGGFHRSCKSARRARRQREKRMDYLHGDGAAISVAKFRVYDYQYVL